ncbi:MAG: ImmA/IrrE family metallo-endopeptidase [Pyrinomonadaceae bacterium]|nr:ImmA/IrrE family metallo-endopeptidase [Pyrinomonadaceae bacterium]
MAVAGNEALINPQILAWARESAGFYLEEAAKKITIEPDKLRSCEVGNDRLTISQLRKLCNVYKRPLAFFYLPTPPPRENLPKDFRRLPEDEGKKLSPNLRLEIRKAKYRREIALDLFKELEIDIPKFRAKATLSDEVYDVGKLIRRLLKVSFEQQEKIKKESRLNFWREKIEDLGTLVFSASLIDLKLMRGFSIDKHPLPIIVLNSKDHHKARIFTLFHEFTHLLLHSGGICDLGEQNKIEVFCNAVAGEALVPTDWLRDISIVQQHKDKSEWDDEKIYSLAERFGVSREVVLRRLLAIDKTTEYFYKQKREQYQAEYRIKTNQEKEEKKTFRVPQHYKVLNQTGRKFARLVVESYRQNKIGLLDVSEYLGTKLKHLPKIEQTLNPSYSAGDKN